MRILHTSDWHIGRSFHGHATLDALRQVLASLVAVVRERQVDVVLVAGDVFDSVTPAAANFAVLTDTLLALREAGAVVIVTSGNHDSAARLGFQAALLREGIHVRTDPALLAEPVTLHDAHGPVQVYGIPYLEPALVGHLWPEASLRSHVQTLSHAMSLVRADHVRRGGRAVVMAHCFAAGIEATPGVEREVRQGGLDVVPVSIFDGVDYAALGHIHGRAELSTRVRYSGAPLHYSFAERDKRRGSWLVELDAGGFAGAEWVPLPVPRPLATIRGPLAELLSDGRFAPAQSAWVSAEYTDPTPQPDPMRRLLERFPWCATVVHAPEAAPERTALSYGVRVREARDEVELVNDFLAHVRAGEGLSDAERALVREVIAARTGQEAVQ